MRFFSAPILLLALLLAPPAQGAFSCQDFFARVGIGERRQVARGLATDGRNAADIRFNEIFETDLRPIGPGEVIRVLRVNRESQQRYNQIFEQLWQDRISSRTTRREQSAVRREYNEFRRWLSRKNQIVGDSNPGARYPALDAQMLHDKYLQTSVANPEPARLAAYFDQVYFDFVVERHSRDLSRRTITVANPNNPDMVAEVATYLNSLDGRILANLAESLRYNASPKLKLFLGGVLGYLLAQGTGILNETVIQPYIYQPTRRYVTNRTREAVNSVVDFAKVFTGGEAAYISSLVHANTAASRLDPKAVQTQPQEEAANSLKEYVTDMGNVLPSFHPVLISQQKNFEAVWQNRIRELQNPLRDELSEFMRTETELLKLRADLARARANNPGATATPEERALERRFVTQMQNLGKKMAGKLADWLFYKVTMPKERALDPAVEQMFQEAYAQYLTSMDVGLLATELSQRVRDHMVRLNKFVVTPDPAAAETARPGATPGAGPREVKPEDRVAAPAAPLQPVAPVAPPPRTAVPAVQ